MKNLWMSKILMDEAGDGTSGGGATGGTTALGAAGAATAAASGGKGTDAASGGGGNSTGGNSDPGAAAGGNAPKTWLDSMPEELRDNATLKKYKGVDELANAYINAQKHISAEKIVIPGKGATEADWTNVFKKLGLPEGLDKYELKFGEKTDKQFADSFKEQAFKSGVLPTQAQKLVEWFDKQASTGAVELQKAQVADIEKGLNGLKAEWGDAYQANMARAVRAVNELGGKEVMAAFDATGAGNDPRILKFLAGVAKTLWKEDSSAGAGTGANNLNSVSPDQAQAQIKSIQGDTTHPYHHADHPAHKEAVKEMQKLFEARYQAS